MLQRCCGVFLIAQKGDLSLLAATPPGDA